MSSNELLDILWRQQTKEKNSISCILFLFIHFHNMKNIIIFLASIVALAIVGYVSSIFYMERTQEGVICDKSDKSFGSCNNVEAKYYYDGMDDVYYLSEINSKITSRFKAGSCVIDAQNIHECTDTNGKKWTIMFNSYMD